MNLTKKLFAPLAVLALMALAAVSVLAPPYKAAHAETARVNVFSTTYSASALDLSDAAGATLVVNAPGAILGDACVASISEDAVDATMTCYIQAAGKAEVRFQNESGTSTNLAGGTVRAFVFPRGTR